MQGKAKGKGRDDLDLPAVFLIFHFGCIANTVACIH